MFLFLFLLLLSTSRLYILGQYSKMLSVYPFVHICSHKIHNYVHEFLIYANRTIYEFLSCFCLFFLLKHSAKSFLASIYEVLDICSQVSFTPQSFMVGVLHFQPNFPQDWALGLHLVSTTQTNCMMRFFEYIPLWNFVKIFLESIVWRLSRSPNTRS